MTVKQLPASNDKLTVEAEIASFTPDLLFDYWTKPGLLVKWWPQQAEVEPGLGGAYHLSWTQMNWHLRGHYTAFEPGKKLAFTWKWDHEPHTTEVVINFEPLPGGSTKLTLTQAPYSDSREDQELRIDHHLVGWKHFIGKLQELKRM